MYDDVLFTDRFRYLLTMFVNRVLIGLTRLVDAHITYDWDTAKIIAAFCRISGCLYDFISWIQSPAPFKQQDVRWCSLRWSIPIFIDYVWESSFDRVISIPSCSYCIWNIYIHNHRSTLPNFLLFAWFDTVEFNRLPCSNNKKDDNIVFFRR